MVMSTIIGIVTVLVMEVMVVLLLPRMKTTEKYYRNDTHRNNRN